MMPELLAANIFLLPGGLMLDGCRRLARAELRPLTGREEEWLATHPDAPAAVAVTRLLCGCMTRLDDLEVSDDLVRKLLVGDRDYLVLQLRRLTLGDDVRAVLACPACRARMDVSFRASEVPVEPRLQVVASYTLQFPAPPPGGRTVRFRLPTGGDQEAVLRLGPGATGDALLDLCLLDDGGAPLSPDERSAVIEGMEGRAPQVELELSLTCPECRHEFVAPFDTTAFFLEEMKISAGQWLREVHTLAFYYHWSEADILSLTRDRRRAYLTALSDTLRQE